MLSERLKSAVLAAATDEAGTWFAAAWPEGEAERRCFGAAFAGARRRLGGAWVPWGGKDWRRDELARAALILRAFEILPDGEHVTFLRQLYAKGDNREKAAVLRALPLLPGGRRFVELAVEACRTNALDVFEAIACENPWPAASFPEPDFERLIVKALSLGVSLSRIEGLAARITPELRRMVGDLARERRAAGRSVSADVSLILEAGSPPPAEFAS